MSRPAARQLIGEHAEDAELVRTWRGVSMAAARPPYQSMGAVGSAAIQPGLAPVIVPALAVEPVDVTGAGDIFVGVFLAVYLNSRDAELAARWAAVGASYSIGAVGVNAVEITAELVEARPFGTGGIPPDSNSLSIFS